MITDINDVADLLRQVRAGMARQPRQPLDDDLLMRARQRSEQAQHRIDEVDPGHLGGDRDRPAAHTVDILDSLLDLHGQLEELAGARWESSTRQPRAGATAHQGRPRAGTRNRHGEIIDVVAFEVPDCDIDPHKLTNVVPIRSRRP